MALTTVLHYLGWSIGILALAMLLPCLHSVSVGDHETAFNFFVSLVVCIFIAGSLIVGFRGRNENLDRMHGALFMVLIWLVLPLCAALPLYNFYLPGSALAAPVGSAEALGGWSVLKHMNAAYFEAVSAFTTTGATIFKDIDLLPSGIILWRSLLQWLGGAVTLISILLIIAPLGVSGLPIHIQIPGYENRDFRRSIFGTSKAVIPVYTLLTLLCCVALFVFNVPFFDAFCLALSTLSTGGFVPTSEGVARYENAMAELILIIFMILGAMNILAHRAVVFRHKIGHRDIPESFAILAACVFAGLVMSVLVHYGAGVEGEVKSIWASIKNGLFRAVSLITTTGFDNASGDHPRVPFMLVLVLVSFGGAAFSTAGGLKLFRVMLMARQCGRELERLVHPSSIPKKRAFGILIDDDNMRSIWVFFTGYIAVVSAVTLILSSQGAEFEPAILAAVSAMSNAGPALNMGYAAQAGEVAAYADMPALSMLVLSLTMVVGRVELLILANLLNIVYWRSKIDAG